MSCIGPSFSEQTKRGLKTPYHVVLVPPAGFKLEGVDARSSRLQITWMQGHEKTEPNKHNRNRACRWIV
jgi:hypothetical protein